MKLRAKLLAALLAQANARCNVSDLSTVKTGNWLCEDNANEGSLPFIVDNRSEDTVSSSTKCAISCNEDHYIMRPGLATYVRCKGDGSWSVRNTDKDDVKMPAELICKAGCNKKLLDNFDNGSWDCPLMEKDDDTIERGLQCFPRCDQGYELIDPSNSIFLRKNFEKICRCTSLKGRCHWTRHDTVPRCAASKRNRIINGQEAKQHSKPYMVSVSIKEKKDGKKIKIHYCGAVLIHPNWVITAAHCKKRGMHVTLGEHDITLEEGVEKTCRVSKTVTHPDYNFGSKNDIMLGKLKCSNMKQSSYIDTAMLPMAMTNPTANQNCDICGWGNMEYPNFKPAEKLQCVELPPIPNQTCNKSYRGAIHDDIMCIGLMAGGKDSCQGDSGGPAICDGRVHGIVMGGLYCAEKDYPGVYTRVSHYTEWIKDIIKKGGNDKGKN